MDLNILLSLLSQYLSYMDVVCRIGQCDSLMISKILKMKTYLQDKNVIGQFLRQKEYKMYCKWTVDVTTVDKQKTCSNPTRAARMHVQALQCLLLTAAFVAE